jgi:hypothetical protein
VETKKDNDQKRTAKETDVADAMVVFFIFSNNVCWLPFWNCVPISWTIVGRSWLQ